MKSFKTVYNTMDAQIDYLLQASLNKSSKASPSLRILFYNGDNDLLCNFLGEQWFAHEVAERNKLSVCIDI
jgi:hypothetical protein